MVITGKDAEIILNEMRNGTLNTEQRIETIRRADSIFKQMNRCSLYSALERILEIAEIERKLSEEDSSQEGRWAVVETIAYVALQDWRSISEDVKANSNGPEATE